MSGTGSGHAPSGAPVVHNVVLGGNAGGKPVNLLELLMEDMPAGDRTTLMETPAPGSAPARPNEDATAPLHAIGAVPRPAPPSEFTAVLQAFQPAAASAVRVPTETDRPRFEPVGASRAGDRTTLVEQPRPGADGAGHTQVMNLPDLSASQAHRQPSPVERVSPIPVPVPVAEEPALSRALRAPAPEAAPVAATTGPAGWVPWLLLAVVVELLAILVVLVLGLKR